MLLLGRKKGESIIINDDIEIIVVDTSKESVLLGFEAPKEIEIVRKELLEIEVRTSPRT